MWESKIWKNNWVAVVNRRESCQQNLLNNPGGREETFFQTFHVAHAKQFSVPTFCGNVWKIWLESFFVDDVLSSHEQEIYPNTSLDENCIEFKFQTDRNYYVDLRQSCLTLTLKFVKGRGYNTYESKEKKKEHKDEPVVFTETGNDEAREEVARVTYVNKIIHSVFSNVEVYINNHQIYKSNEVCAHKSHISNNFKPAISEYNGVLHCEGYDYGQDPDVITNPLPDPFLQGEWNC